jgi:Cof subfamily protein (haloacid dehalogenase superfamily)
VTTDRWLVALDIDGTLLTHRGVIEQGVIDAVTRVKNAGHEVMLATGRAMAETIEVLEALDIWPEFIVCSNGAVVWKRDPLAEIGYSQDFVKTFSPESALTTIKPFLPEGKYAIEDANGDFYFTEPFPGMQSLYESHQVSFDELLHIQATRVVVISPAHDTDEFLAAVEKMGLNRVTYAIGLTAWLDIAPEGINKATGLERVREALDIPRSNLFAIGDGRNDIDMLRWASQLGRGVAMGDAPDEVLAAANEVTAPASELGAIAPLLAIPGV